MQGVLFQPTEEQRRLVRAFAGFGIRQEDIAAHLGIEPKTLRRHFRIELDRGAVEANAKVAQSLFQMATQGKNVAAAIFWMKARAGWREKQEVAVTHTGKPLHELSDAELERMIQHVRDSIEFEDEEAAAAAAEQQPAVTSPG